MRPMKKIFTMLMLSTFFCSAASAQSAAETRDIEMTITLDTTTFYYYQMAEGFIIDSFEYNFQPHCAAGEPNVPWVNVLVPIDQGEEFVCYTYSYTEKTIREDFDFAPFMGYQPIDDKAESSSVTIYPDSIYPKEHVIYGGYVHAIDLNALSFGICPFTYIAQSHQLNLLEIKLCVTVRNQPAGIISPESTSAGQYRNCQSPNRPCYSLSGRRLTTLPTRKGIYIKDGRKVLIK